MSGTAVQRNVQQGFKGDGITWSTLRPPLWSGIAATFVVTSTRNARQYVIAVSGRNIVMSLELSDDDFLIKEDNSPKLFERFCKPKQWNHCTLIMPYPKNVPRPPFCKYAAVDKVSDRLFITFGDKSGVYASSLSDCIHRRRAGVEQVIRPEPGNNNRVFFGLAFDDYSRILYCCSPVEGKLRSCDVGAWLFSDSSRFGQGQFKQELTIRQPKLAPFKCAVSPVVNAGANNSRILAVSDLFFKEVRLFALDESGKVKNGIHARISHPQLSNDNNPACLYFDSPDVLFVSFCGIRQVEVLSVDVSSLEANSLKNSSYKDFRIGRPLLNMCGLAIARKPSLDNGTSTYPEFLIATMPGNNVVAAFRIDH